MMNHGEMATIESALAALLWQYPAWRLPACFLVVFSVVHILSAVAHLVGWNG